MFLHFGETVIGVPLPKTPVLNEMMPIQGWNTQAYMQKPREFYWVNPPKKTLPHPQKKPHQTQSNYSFGATSNEIFYYS